MAMVKVFSPSGWNFEVETLASMVKMASDGLRGNDRTDFIKRAGSASNVFLPYLDSVKFAKDEVPMHLIAVGASEAYGPNRNGDGFKEATCKGYHDTFVKFARKYRNHKNKDPKISYGTVKLSAYNPEMRRIELLVALNGDKTAADRNGGFVADREIEKLARGEDIPVSMACRVPYDICSGCGHQARTRDEYCTSRMCKVGGCKENLTRLVKVGNDVHHVHVDNPYPSFFDISHVFRPADRIAYGGKADYITKAAEEMGYFGEGGAKFASDMEIVAPLAVILSQDVFLPGEWAPYMAEQMKLAHGLDTLEKNASLQPDAQVRRAFTLDMQPELNLDDFGLQSKFAEDVAAGLGALASQKIVLSLRDFARMTKRAEITDYAVQCLPGVIGRMIDDGSLERRLGQNKYAPAEKLASAKVRSNAARVKSAHSLDVGDVRDRVIRSTIRGLPVPDSKNGYWNEKKASDSPLAEELARDYACYKVAALRHIARNDDQFLLTARLALSQNQVV